MSALADNWWLGEGSLPGPDKMPGAPLPPSPAAPVRIQWLREAPRLGPAAPVRTPRRPRPALRLAEGMIRTGGALALLLAGVVLALVLVVGAEGVARLIVAVA